MGRARDNLNGLNWAFFQGFWSRFGLIVLWTMASICTKRCVQTYILGNRTQPKLSILASGLRADPWLYTPRKAGWLYASNIPFMTEGYCKWNKARHQDNSRPWDLKILSLTLNGQPWHIATRHAFASLRQNCRSRRVWMQTTVICRYHRLNDLDIRQSYGRWKHYPKKDYSFTQGIYIQRSVR
jgi:hypothetical protein